MAEKEYDLWQERFRRECGIRSAVILYGNTGDLAFDARTHMYTGLIPVLLPMLRELGFERITRWDRVNGSVSLSGQAPMVQPESQPQAQGGSVPYDAGAFGDLGDGCEAAALPPRRTPADIQREFTEIYHMLQQPIIQLP